LNTKANAAFRRKAAEIFRKSNQIRIFNVAKIAVAIMKLLGRSFRHKIHSFIKLADAKGHADIIYRI